MDVIEWMLDALLYFTAFAYSCPSRPSCRLCDWRKTIAAACSADFFLRSLNNNNTET